MEAALALARWTQLAAAMAVCGAPLFHLGGPRGAMAAGARPTVLIAAVLGAAATLAWLIGRSLDLGGLSVLGDLAASTQFGRAASVRLAAFILVAVLALARARWAYLVLSGAVAAASLAWTGHAAGDDGLAGALHMTADVVHVLAAAAWLGALIPLLILVRQARDPAAAEAARAGLRRFSGIGPTLVGLLIATGLINSAFLIGLDHVADLAASPYGRLLLIKLGLFVVMLALAALNRWVLTPRLATRGLALSLGAEIAAGAAVLAAVAVLGALIPPASV